MTTTAIKRRKARRQASFANADPLFEISESVALLEQATESNQSQIREVAETTNRAIQELAANTSRQYREVTVLIEKQGAEARTEIKALGQSFAASQKPNFLLWIGIAALLLTIIGGGMAVIRLSIENATLHTILPLQASIDANSARDTSSEMDRQKLNVAAEKRDERITKNETLAQVMLTKLIEVETQFRSKDQANNVQFSEQQRMNNILMQLAQGRGGKDNPMEYPRAPYYFPTTTADGKFLPNIQ